MFESARQISSQPLVILTKTLKGKSVSFLEDQDGWYGKSVSKAEQMERALRELALGNM